MSLLITRIMAEVALRDLRRLDELDSQGAAERCTPGATEEDCRSCPARPDYNKEGVREVCLWQH